MEFQSEKFIKFIKSFWLKYEPKIVLGLGLILVAVISFEFGLIQGRKGDNRPMIIEKPILGQNVDAQTPSVSAPQAQNSAVETKIAPESISASTKDCAFVGSKNSNKYHLPTCQWAKRILAKNMVCFKSAEDAVAKGYQADKGCVK